MGICCGNEDQSVNPVITIEDKGMQKREWENIKVREIGTTDEVSLKTILGNARATFVVNMPSNLRNIEGSLREQTGQFV